MKQNGAMPYHLHRGSAGTNVMKRRQTRARVKIDEGHRMNRTKLDKTTRMLTASVFSSFIIEICTCRPRRTTTTRSIFFFLLAVARRRTATDTLDHKICVDLRTSSSCLLFHTHPTGSRLHFNGGQTSVEHCRRRRLGANDRYE